MPGQHVPEKSVFLAAIEITSAAERAAYLDRACRDDPHLRAEVEALLRAHEEPQRLLDVPEAGTWLAAPGPYVGLPNPTVQVWDATTGKTRHVLRGHTELVSCLAFSPDERYLATGSFDRKLTLWDVTTGSQVATYCGHNTLLQAVSFSGDGKQVVSLDANGVIKTWDATHPPDCIVLKGGQIAHATFSPDGRHVAAGVCGRRVAVGVIQADFLVRVWEAASGAEVAKFTTEAAAPTWPASTWTAAWIRPSAPAALPTKGDSPWTALTPASPFSPTASLCSGAATPWFACCPAAPRIRLSGPTASRQRRPWPSVAKPWPSSRTVRSFWQARRH
jgi:hypothetical protein